MYNKASVTINIASNEGFGLGTRVTMWNTNHCKCYWWSTRPMWIQKRRW